MAPELGHSKSGEGSKRKAKPGILGIGMKHWRASLSVTGLGPEW